MTSATVICGIDIGTTNVKALLIDEQAQTLWSRSIPVPRVAVNGSPSTDAASLVATLEQLIIEGWRACGLHAPIAAIATTGVGEDGIPVDLELKPLDLAIPWFDRRAEGDGQALRGRLDKQVRAGVPIDGTRTVAKWRWLRHHRPEVLRDASSWLALTDYPAAWWSKALFMSETLAARTGAYDVFDRSWLPSHLDAAGAPPLPPVRPARTVVGTMAGGALIESGAASKNTLLVSGGHDHPVAASVVRRIDPTALVDSLGTANLVYGEAAAIEPRTDPYLAFSVPVLGQPGVACLGVFEFAASLAPLQARDGGASLRDFLAADHAPGEPGNERQILQALQHALRRAVASDIGFESVAPRTVLEGSSFYARLMLQAVRDIASTHARVYSVGGWARSKALLQLRASVLGEPLVTIDEQELTALGAALMARDAAAPASAGTFQRDTRVTNPDPDWQARYERMFETVCEAVPAFMS